MGKSGEKWESEEKRWELVANFLPPFVNTLEQFLLFFYTYMDHTRHSVSFNEGPLDHAVFIDSDHSVPDTACQQIF